MGHKSTEKYNDICALKHNMLHYVMGETEKGFEDDPTKVHVLKEYIGMVKDLAEAEKACQEACYYESVVEAMDNADMFEDNTRMGYNRKRNRLGQYSDGAWDGRRFRLQSAHGLYSRYESSVQTDDGRDRLGRG